ncbi:MAG: SUMF1/EgtB/PvdO family nonheme iron enzyme [Planctomycetes bacterium]|nr:SUMF1/EgtB/PvdO family nonheme iron enzyme [Planctomycetota bacterium]
MRAASGFLRTLAALVLGAAVLREGDLPAGKGEAPASVDLRPQLEGWGLVPRSQGARGTCSVFATVGALELAVSRHYGRGTALSVEYLNWASNAAMRDPTDGGFFHDLLRGFEEHGICLEADMPYQAEFDAGLKPSGEAVTRAKEIRGLDLRVHWINPWKPEAGLTDEHLREIKAVLAKGYPVAAGSGHSRLIVGCVDDAEQPGGGAFVMKDSAAAAYITMSYGDAQALIGDVFWVEAAGFAKKARDPATGITFILVDPGKFEMGSPQWEVEGYLFDDERPRHEVEITKLFYLSETEVTVGQWREFAKRTGYRTEAEESGEGGYTDDAAGLGDDSHPVTQVSWKDAQAFCAAYGYRLPSEAEWEYACRAGTSTAYWWGDDELDGKGAGNFQDQLKRARHPPPFDVFPHGDGRAFTAPVGTYAANPWGFLDMLGNVEEWCADVYDKDFYARSPRKDPLSAEDTGFGHALRGGSWRSGPSSCRSAVRSFSFPFDGRSDSIGFRVAR